MMTDAYIVDAVRTPIGRAGGVLSTLEVQLLLAPLIQALICRNQLDGSAIDEVIVGNAAGPGGNPARVALLEAGLPVSVPGLSVDRQCGSGLEAINLGLRLVQSGAASLVLAGGVESVSTAPLRARPAADTGQAPQFYQRARFAPDAVGDPEMGEAAENIARKYAISRARQDKFALHSQQKAVKAWQRGAFASEIVALQSAGKRISRDECPRADTTLARLAQLPAVFADDGSITAGNACALNDGAALVLISSAELPARGDSRRSKALRLIDTAAAGVDPCFLGLGPVAAIEKLALRCGLSVEKLTSGLAQIEFNEAFAAQVLACIDQLDLDQARLNPAGGALALGHPYGASGAVLVTRLLHALLPGQRGLATLGIGGGQGLASLFEAL